MTLVDPPRYAAASFFVVAALGPSPGSAAESATRHRRPPRLRHVRLPQSLHGLRLPEAVGHPHRLRGARPRGLRRRPDAGPAGRLDAEHRPRDEGRGRKSYTFRTSDKDPTRILPPEWAGTVSASSSRMRPRRTTPASASSCPRWPRPRACSTRHPRYVFMPDDTVLGEFRTTFGGQPGMIEEFPLSGKTAPRALRTRCRVARPGICGSASSRARRGSTSGRCCACVCSICGSGLGPSQPAWRGPQGERTPRLVPLPEDRDQAFSRFGGLLLATVAGRTRSSWTGAISTATSKAR